MRGELLKLVGTESVTTPSKPSRRLQPIADGPWKCLESHDGAALLQHLETGKSETVNARRMIPFGGHE